jgi:putative ABC transport system permease protein
MSTVPGGLGLAWRLARRELRSGLSGFRVFFACLVLGVAAIAGVGSLTQALLQGMSGQGRVLLGGDAAIDLVHRPATAQEHAFFVSHGRTAETISMRAMAYALKNGREAERQLIELKAVDDAYPLYGSVGLIPAQGMNTALACSAWSCGVAVEQTLLYRLHAKRGDLVRIGDATFRIGAILGNEPDRISGGFSLGPHVIMSDTGLQRTGLVVLGSLIEYSYRIALPPSASIAQFKRDATQAFPDAGWQIRDRDNAAPGTRRFIEQVNMFLTLVGLTALAVGGVGAGQAVRAFLDRKQEEIATFKSLGADGNLIFLTFFLQVMAIALVAVITGLIVGSALPFVVAYFFGSDIDVPAVYALYATPLLLAAVFGVFSAMAFAILPLARAREIPPASLFREIVAPARARGRWPYLAATIGSAAIIVGLAAAIAPSLAFTGWFIAGTAGALIILRLAAEGLRWGLRHVPRPANASLRLALGNLTRPGSTASAVIVALGLGLTLLATVTLLDRTIMAQVDGALPQSAPTFFFVDIQPSDAAAFDRTIARFASARDYKRTPMIRGRIVALKGIPAKDAKVAGDSRWALNGDRGITYAAKPPEGSEIVSGKWWPADYAGPPLISFDSDLAKGMGLKLGDTMTLNVLGRDITGRIANLRDVNFATGRQNFVLILSPGLIDKAPHSFLATVRVAPKDEDAMYRAVTDRFHSVSAIRVKDAIAQVNAILQELGFGVRAASLVTILAGLLVLAGAIAAGQRARLYDATIMKVLGATRGQIALVYAVEYGLLGTLAGLIALAAGSAAAYEVAHQVFNVAAVFDLRAVLLTVVGGGLATLAFGLLSAVGALSARPAARLRSP